MRAQLALAIVVAILVGTLFIATPASAANPFLTFLEENVVPKLDAILAAVNGVDQDLQMKKSFYVAESDPITFDQPGTEFFVRTQVSLVNCA